MRGLRVAGAEADAPLTARQADLRGPLVIVVGSEGQGLGPAVRRRCDLFVRIPMRGAVGSLNAAVAGSILLFEAVAQRDPDRRGAGAAATRRAADGPTIARRAADAADAPTVRSTTPMAPTRTSPPRRPTAEPSRLTPAVRRRPRGREATRRADPPRLTLRPGGPIIPRRRWALRCPPSRRRSSIG